MVAPEPRGRRPGRRAPTGQVRRGGPTRAFGRSVTTSTRFGIVLGWSPPREFPARGGRRNSAHVRARPRRLRCRARHPCVHFLQFHSAVAADKAFQRGRSRRSRDQARSPDQDRRRPGRQAARAIAPRGRRGVPEATTSATAWCCSARSSRSRPTTARTGCGSPAPSSRSAPPTTATAATLLERAGTAAYIAYQRAKNRNEEADSLVIVGRSFGDRRRLAAGARCAAAVARAARGRRRARALREDARGPRLPPARLFGRCGRRFAARLLPVLRDAARQAHRLLAVRRGRGHRQARAVGRRQAALRRRAQARRALQRDAARRPAVDRQGDAGEVRRPHDLRARPQADGALCRQGLRAAAHRPARHPGGQRQHQGGDDRDLSHRRPQPDRHRARPRLPAQSRPLRHRAADREPRHQGVERRARGRADAQRRGDHRVSGRSGGRRHGARRLCDDRGGQGHAVRRLRHARDPMVHRLRPRARRLFRQ